MNDDKAPLPRYDRVRLLAGLLVPGLGPALRGDWLTALLVLWAVAFLGGMALVALIVHHLAGYPVPFDLFGMLAALPWPMPVPPEVAFAGVAALSVHVLVALGAARSAT